MYKVLQRFQYLIIVFERTYSLLDGEFDGQLSWHVGTLFAWEPGDLLLDRTRYRGVVRVGKTRSRS